ncbi:hypothetical protein E2H86_25490 [Pseudomonas putida]|nr:hypothetical protein E2H86_25490 [Pseudomonas putida]
MNNNLSLKFKYLINSLTSIISILITTIDILILIYNNNYISHNQKYLKFFTYLTLFNISILKLITNSNLIQIYIF